MIYKRDELLSLASRAATSGLDALGRFTGARLEPPIPSCEWLADGAESIRSDAHERPLGLFADLDGAVAGRVALVVSVADAQTLAGDFLRTKSSGAAAELLGCSALLEAANITFSAAAGALGDATGVIVFPSIPRMGQDFEAELPPESPRPDRDIVGVYCAQGALVAAGLRTEVAFIWIPDRSQ